MTKSAWFLAAIALSGCSTLPHSAFGPDDTVEVLAFAPDDTVAESTTTTSQVAVTTTTTSTSLATTSTSVRTLTEDATEATHPLSQFCASFDAIGTGLIDDETTRTLRSHAPSGERDTVDDFLAVLPSYYAFFEHVRSGTTDPQEAILSIDDPDLLEAVTAGIALARDNTLPQTGPLRIYSWAADHCDNDKRWDRAPTALVQFEPTDLDGPYLAWNQSLPLKVTNDLARKETATLCRDTEALLQWQDAVFAGSSSVLAEIDGQAVYVYISPARDESGQQLSACPDPLDAIAPAPADSDE